MTHQEIREKFLNFFKERGHVIVPSSSLISDDPSVLLTTAGMQQFKEYYTGQADPEKTIHPTLGKPLGARRAVSIQKSFRTSDIEAVGDESHLTFFEMLGNFSFGDYFKKEAIEWAYELINSEFKISKSRIKVSVFAGDDEVPKDEESVKIWQGLGFKDEEIFYQGRADNFWGPTGKEGPCGPTTEIYIDGIEIWNLVFNQYYCFEDNHLELLKQNGVDTGMGMERLARVLQNKNTIFETDLFEPFFALIKTNNLRLKRIIADHLRASVFLVGDGILPANQEQGYILRRLLRRVIRYGRLEKLTNDFYLPLVQKIIDLYSPFYPTLKTNASQIITVIREEAKKFNKTLTLGLKEFKKMIEQGKISGKDAFNLYQSYGFPFELTQELAKEKGVVVSKEDFEAALKKHQEVSRAGQERKFGGHGLLLDTGELKAASREELQKVIRLHTATHLLHAALRQVLGPHIRQMGSDINPKRTRFDFTHPQKVTPEQLKKIEALVNQKIKQDLPVKYETMSYHQALKAGALAFFKEKYPSKVRVYTIEDPTSPKGFFSKELCAGPHVTHTGQIGHFKILKEEASSAGVRRIRATID